MQQTLLAQLLKKEFRLQQSSVYIAFGIYMLEILLFIFSFQAQQVLIPKMLTVGELIQMIHYFVILPGLLVLFPLMLGASTIANERSLDVFDWQLSLPLERWKQLAMKAIVALGFALVLGSSAAWFLDHILAWLLARRDVEFLFGTERELIMPFRLGGIWIGFYVMLFTAIGAYTSSLTRDPFRALMVSAFLIVLTLLAHPFLDPQLLLAPWWPEPQWPLVLHASVLMIFLFALALPNYQLIGFRLRRVLLQMFIWIVFINLAGCTAVNIKWRIDSVCSKENIAIPGIQKLLGNRENSVEAEGHVFRILNSDRFLTNVTKRTNKSHAAFKSFDPTEKFQYDRVVEGNVQSGTIKQAPNVVGSVGSLGHNRSFAWVEGFGDFDAGYLVGTHLGLSDFFFVIPETIAAHQALHSSSQDGRYNSLTASSLLHSKKEIVIVQGDETIAHLEKGWGGYVNALHQEKGMYVVSVSNRKPYPERRWKSYFVRHIPNSNRFELIKKLPHEGYPSIRVSSDGEWYYDRGELPTRILKTDHSKEYILGKSDEFVVLSRPDGRISEFISPEIRSKRRIITLSPDNRYLGFSRFRHTFPTEHGRFDICLLDLTNGDIVLLEQFNPSKWDLRWIKENSSLEQARIYEKNWMGWEKPSFAWSDKNRLAVLYHDRLDLYERSEDEGRIEFKPLVRNLDIGFLYNQDTFIPRILRYRGGLSRVSFWSNEMLLIWGYEEFWRLDVAEHLAQSGTVVY